jgi:DNA-binding NarL/FixJ family response regulator
MRQLWTLDREARVLFVTERCDPAYMREAMRAGVSGYVSKLSPPAELFRAIDKVLAGGTYIAPPLAPALGADTAPQPSAASILTPRQREVLYLVAGGRRNKEIADTLEISLKTVEFHKACIMDALGLRTTAELTRYALAHGLAGK